MKLIGMHQIDASSAPDGAAPVVEGGKVVYGPAPETPAGAQAKADAAEANANAYTDAAVAAISPAGGGGGTAGLLVRDGVIPLEPVGMDSSPDEWLYADGTTTAGSGGGVTDHGALTGLADDDHPQYVKGQVGRSYKMLGGVLRKSGGVWGLLNDSGHQPLGLGAVTASSTAVTIAVTLSAYKVTTVVVGADETYAADHTAGASVGTSSIVISIYKNGVLQNPTTMPDSGSGNFWITGMMEA